MPGGYKHFMSSKLEKNNKTVVLLKTPGLTKVIFFHVDLFQSSFCQPFLLGAARTFSDYFIADAG